MNTGSQNDRADIDILFFHRLLEIDGAGLAHAPADVTLALFQVKTAFIDIRYKRNGLRKVYMYGLVVRNFLVKRIRVLNRAIFYTCRTAGALFLDDVSGFLGQGDRKISCLPRNAVNFRKCQNLYIWMPADLDQFR